MAFAAWQKGTQVSIVRFSHRRQINGAGHSHPKYSNNSGQGRQHADERKPFCANAPGQACGKRNNLDAFDYRRENLVGLLME
tara:strand:- start:15056 stop:15301 length:246 start_codon:yes stop_codon:yes gene_type:complete